MTLSLAPSTLMYLLPPRMAYQLVTLSGWILLGRASESMFPLQTFPRKSGLGLDQYIEQPVGKGTGQSKWTVGGCVSLRGLVTPCVNSLSTDHVSTPCLLGHHGGMVGAQKSQGRQWSIRELWKP